MGKKKKERESYWDIDDQQAAADAFFAFETGNGELFIKEDEIDANGIAGPLANLIGNDLANGRKAKDEEDSYVTPVTYEESEDTDSIDYDSVSIGYDVGDSIPGYEEENTISPIADMSSNVLVSSPDLRMITASVFEPVWRVLINDFIAPTAFAYGYEMECENLEKYASDPQEASNIISKIWEYIISLKHPTAIFTFDEFIKYFGKTNSYSTVDFVFFVDHNNKRIYAYYVNAESISNVNRYANEFLSSSVLELIQFFVSLAYAAGRIDQVFFAENEGYVNNFENSEYNQKSLFTKVFLNHDNTVFFDDQEGDIDYICGHMAIKDIVELQGEVRELLTDIIDGEDDDDDDEPEEIKEEVTEPVKEVTPVEENKDTTEEQEKVVEDEEEPEEDITLTIEDSEEIEIPKEEPKVEESKKSPETVTQVSESTTNTIKVVRKVR